MLVAIGAYVLAVGWQPSVVRAGVAGGLASLAWLTARPRERWHALALGALVLLAWMPCDAARARLPALVRRGRGDLPRGAVPRALARGVSGAAGLRESSRSRSPAARATAPIAWLHFGVVPLYTVPANALAWPVAAPLLILGLLAAIVQPVLPSAAYALAWGNGWLAAYLAWVAHAVAGLPYAQVGSPVAFATGLAAVGGLVVLARLRSRDRLIALAGVVAVATFGLGFRSVHEPPLVAPAGLRVIFLDVGQGDSALLQTAAGSVLVDEGPPEAHVGRQLHSLGVDHLAALVLTHPERDHVGGAVEVLRTLQVDRVLHGGPAHHRPDGDAALAEARRRHVPITVVRAGDSLRLGRLTLRVLWPDGPGTVDANPNDWAVVMLASYGETDVFLPADAESNVTARLRPPAVEILKVAHHGSADDGLVDELRALRPRVALISVGAHNDYGHPRAEVVSALEGVPGLTLLRTDRDGRVTIETGGRELATFTER